VQLAASATNKQAEAALGAGAPTLLIHFEKFKLDIDKNFNPPHLLWC
jgi:hypothetical protein